eukprot:5330-Chlamydomonas_euryale.AAC.1
MQLGAHSEMLCTCSTVRSGGAPIGDGSPGKRARATSCRSSMKGQPCGSGTCAVAARIFVGEVEKVGARLRAWFRGSVVMQGLAALSVQQLVAVPGKVESAGGWWRALESAGGRWRALESAEGHGRAVENVGGHGRAVENVGGHGRARGHCRAPVP